jgi:hypothetical protein
MQEQVTIMMTYYRTDDQVIHEEEKLSDGVWVQKIFKGYADFYCGGYMELL